MSPRQLAQRVGVTAKTVERWVADEQLCPHARNREDAAQALGVEARMLWPRAVTERVRSGADREILHSYPYRSACPSTVWGELVARAEHELYFAGYTNYFLFTQQPRFLDTLREKLTAGCRVRFLVGDPDAAVTREREIVENVRLTVSTRIRTTLDELGRLPADSGLQARFSHPQDAPSHLALSVFRFDDEALVTPHLARGAGHDSPLLHLRRHGEGGLFDRFTEHAEELWERGVPVTAES